MTVDQSLQISVPVDNGVSMRTAAAFVLDAQSLQLMRHCLPRLGFEAEDIKRGDVRDAIRTYSKAQSPELLIVDISHFDMPLSELETLANVCAPDVKVVVVGDQDNVGLYRNLMRYGVSEYLVKPLPSDVLFQSLRQVCGGENINFKANKTGKTIGVMGAKGGVGGSTILAGLSDVLSRQYHRRVMMLDMNFHDGDLALFFGKRSQQGLLELLKSSHRIDDLFIERVAVSLGPRFDLLFGDQAIEQSVEISSEALEKLFERLRKNYHFIISDIMKMPIPSALRLLEDSDVRVVVMDRGLGSIRTAAKMLKRLQVEQGQKQNIVILNNPRPSLKRDISPQDIEDVIQYPIDFEISYDGRSCADAALAAKPVSQVKGKIGSQITEIANSLVGPVLAESQQNFIKKIVWEGQNVWKKIR
ncbi:MAG: AAA family ATPase [Sneathiella sp.]